MADKYTVLRGIRYPASKTIRDKIRAKEATSADVKSWKSVPAGSKGITIPADLIPEFKRRDAIEKES